MYVGILKRKLTATALTALIVFLLLGLWGALTYILASHGPVEVYDAVGVIFSIGMGLAAIAVLIGLIAGIAFTAEVIYSFIMEEIRRVPELNVWMPYRMRRVIAAVLTLIPIILFFSVWGYFLSLGIDISGGFSGIMLAIGVTGFTTIVLFVIIVAVAKAIYNTIERRLDA